MEQVLLSSSCRRIESLNRFLSKLCTVEHAVFEMFEKFVFRNKNQNRTSIFPEARKCINCMIVYSKWGTSKLRGDLRVGYILT